MVSDACVYLQNLLDYGIFRIIIPIMEKTFEFFRHPDIARKLVLEIRRLLKEIGTRVALMEVCGTHTMAISRWGLRKILPERLFLLSGPGCPVCVTPQETIDYAIEVAECKDVIITTFGDMVKVPGSKGTLKIEKTKVVYAPTDALKIANQNPDKRVVFIGVGFETTIPTVAATIKMAQKNLRLNNFYIIQAFKLVPPALRAIAEMKKVRIDGLILPGHVSTIIGSRAYEFLAREYGLPCAITGFEPIDILEGIVLLLRQIKDKKPKIEIQYQRVVHPEGNIIAQKIMNEVFERTPAHWRGLGEISDSGLKLKNRFTQFSAEQEFPIKIRKAKEHKDCLCGQILIGARIPFDCRLFGRVCTPTNPVGPCMVSSEGSCAAYYKYERK
ncbi:MAG: hydrogenase formation protein HypD [candidate division WOR-3 bacterium]